MTTVGAWLASHASLDRLDRELLVCRAVGLSRAQVLTRPERPLAPAATARLDEWAARRLNGEPLAYILGSREFRGLDFRVTPAVLVPRPDTELLVEVALGALRQLWERPPGRDLAAHATAAGRPLPQGVSPRPRALELGTGSGAVAVAVARELPDVTVTATDVSAAALEVAAGNAARHGVGNISWVQSDWFVSVAGRFELIVANPPYVAEHDPHLADLGHEPRGALIAGPDGLSAIRRIIGGAGDHLTAAGVLALEHGCDQDGAVRALLTAAGFVDVTTHPDLAGHPRVTRGTRQER